MRSGDGAQIHRDLDAGVNQENAGVIDRLFQQLRGLRVGDFGRCDDPPAVRKQSDELGSADGRDRGGVSIGADGDSGRDVEQDIGGCSSEVMLHGIMVLIL